MLPSQDKRTIQFVDWCTTEFKCGINYQPPTVVTSPFLYCPPSVPPSFLDPRDHLGPWDPTTDRATDRTIDRAIDRPIDRGIDRPPGPLGPYDRPSDRPNDRPSDRPTEPGS